MPGNSIPHAKIRLEGLKARDFLQLLAEKPFILCAPLSLRAVATEPQKTLDLYIQERKNNSEN